MFRVLGVCVCVCIVNTLHRTYTQTQYWKRNLVFGEQKTESVETTADAVKSKEKKSNRFEQIKGMLFYRFVDE